MGILLNNIDGLIKEVEDIYSVPTPGPAKVLKAILSPFQALKNVTSSHSTPSINLPDKDNIGQTIKGVAKSIATGDLEGRMKRAGV